MASRCASSPSRPLIWLRPGVFVGDDVQPGAVVPVAGVTGHDGAVRGRERPDHDARARFGFVPRVGGGQVCGKRTDTAQQSKEQRHVSGSHGMQAFHAHYSIAGIIRWVPRQKSFCFLSTGRQHRSHRWPLADSVAEVLRISDRFTGRSSFHERVAARLMRNAATPSAPVIDGWRPSCALFTKSWIWVR